MTRQKMLQLKKPLSARKTKLFTVTDAVLAFRAMVKEPSVVLTVAE